MKKLLNQYHDLQTMFFQIRKIKEFSTCKNLNQVIEKCKKIAEEIEELKSEIKRLEESNKVLLDKIKENELS